MTIPVHVPEESGALTGLLRKSAPMRGKIATLNSKASSAQAAACLQERYGSRKAKISMDMCTILRVENTGARDATNDVEISGMAN